MIPGIEAHVFRRIGLSSQGYTYAYKAGIFVRRVNSWQAYWSGLGTKEGRRVAAEAFFDEMFTPFSSKFFRCWRWSPDGTYGRPMPSLGFHTEIDGKLVLLPNVVAFREEVSERTKTIRNGVHISLISFYCNAIPEMIERQQPESANWSFAHCSNYRTFIREEETVYQWVKMGSPLDLIPKEASPYTFD